MQDLNAIAIFVRVVEAGSFSQAARDSGIPKATVSRKVAELEAKLGTKLLYRTTRKLYLTEAGNLYFQRCRHILCEVEAASQTLAALQTTPQGTLKIAAPVIFGSAYLSDWIAEFLQQYEQIKVQLLLTNQHLDLIAEGIDVGFKWQRIADPSLETHKLRRVFYWACASQDYLQQYGEPEVPQDLLQHRCIAIAGHPFSNQIAWQFVDANGVTETIPINGALVVNDLILARQAAIAGVGITYLPNSVLAEPLATNRLKRVLPNWSFREGTLYLTYLSQPYIPSKVRTFVDFITEKFPEGKKRFAT